MINLIAHKKSKVNEEFPVSEYSDSPVPKQFRSVSGLSENFRGSPIGDHDPQRTISPLEEISTQLEKTF